MSKINSRMAKEYDIGAKENFGITTASLTNIYCPASREKSRRSVTNGTI
jgi:hypothetical protein